MELVKSFVNHVVLALFLVVVLGGLKLGWDLAPHVVDAVNAVNVAVDGGGFRDVVNVVWVPVVDTVKVLVVLAVGLLGFGWARARV